MSHLPKLPVFLVLLSALVATVPVVFAQSLSPVRYLPGDDTLGPAPLDQDQPDVARGGDQFLAVWRDFRGGGTENVLAEGGADIFASRLDADGNALDVIPISQGETNQNAPKVAWNGTHWLVVWQTQIQPVFAGLAELRAVRIAPDGTVLDVDPIGVYTDTESSRIDFDVASDGVNWLVAAQGNGGTYDLRGFRVDPTGTVLDPGGVVIRPGSGPLIFDVGVAFATDTYLITYDGGGRLVSPDLQPVGTLSLGTYIRPASNGTEFFILRTSGVGSLLRLHGYRISRDGTVLDPGGILISEVVASTIAFPGVAWNGTSWTTTHWRWDSNFDLDLWAARVAADGTVLDPDNVRVGFVNDYAATTALARTPGGGVRVVFQDTTPATGTSDILTLALSPTLDGGPVTTVAVGAPAQRAADIAAHGGGSLVVFRSERSDVERVLVHPLDVNGDPVLSEPIEVGSGTQVSDPRVAWNGAQYLVAWSDGDDLGDVLARRLAPDGTPLDPAPVRLMEGFDPDVAALGDDFLVVAIQNTGSRRQEPFGVRVDGPTGAVLDAVPRDVGSNHTRAVSLTAVGGRWVLVYQRHPSHDDPSALISSTLIEPSGAVATGLSLGSGSRPDVTSNGTTAFTVWHGVDVFGRVIRPAGTVLPTITVNAADERQSEAVIGWDGEQHIALYEDLRNTMSSSGGRSDVFATRLSETGSVLDPNGFAIFDDDLSEIEPAVAGSGGVATLVASVFRASSPYGSFRVAYRRLGELAASVTVSATPVDSLVVIPADGGSFDFTVTLTNTTAQAQSFQAWTSTTGPLDSNPVMAPRSVTLQPGQTVIRTLSQQVPAAAPPGSYVYRVNVGSFGGVVSASASFAVDKDGAGIGLPRSGSESEAWRVSGWDEVEAASRSGDLPDGSALSVVYPNPSTSQARLTLEVAEAQAVRVEVYDALGRRVAVLHDGMVETGSARTLTLDATGLPSGAYIVRVAGETFTAARRVSILH